MLREMSDVNMTNRQREDDHREPPSEPPEHPRRPGRAAVRRRLLNAALKVFAEHGYANARLDHVAAAAGLTKGAIYSNFASKDEIFFAMLDEQILTRVAAVRTALMAAPVGADRPMVAHHVGRLLTKTITEQREWQLVFLDFWLRAVRDDDVRALFLTHRRELRAAIAEAVVQIIGPGPAPSEFSVDDVVTVVLALSNGLAVEQYIDADFVSTDLFGRVLAQLST
jgi:AcrR family transcriptional regulator